MFNQIMNKMNIKQAKVSVPITEIQWYTCIFRHPAHHLRIQWSVIATLIKLKSGHLLVHASSRYIEDIKNGVVSAPASDASTQ